MAENKIFYFNSKFNNFTLVMRSRCVYRDKNNERQKDEGRRIVFEDGKFSTSDPDEIKFMENHIKMFPHFTKQSQKEIEKQSRIQQKAVELVEEEDKKEKKDTKQKKEDFKEDKK